MRTLEQIKIERRRMLDKVDRRTDRECASRLIHLCLQFPKEVRPTKFIFGNGTYAIHGPVVTVKDEYDDNLELDLGNLIKGFDSSEWIDRFLDQYKIDVFWWDELQELLEFWLDTTWGCDVEIPQND